MSITRTIEAEGKMATARVDSRWSSGDCSSPCHCAISKGNLDCLKELLHFNANLDLKNKRGDAPIHEAIQSLGSARQRSNKSEQIELQGKIFGKRFVFRLHSSLDRPLQTSSVTFSFSIRVRSIGVTPNSERFCISPRVSVKSRRVNCCSSAARDSTPSFALRIPSTLPFVFKRRSISPCSPTNSTMLPAIPSEEAETNEKSAGQTVGNLSGERRGAGTSSNLRQITNDVETDRSERRVEVRRSELFRRRRSSLSPSFQADHSLLEFVIDLEKIVPPSPTDRRRIEQIEKSSTA